MLAATALAVGASILLDADDDAGWPGLGAGVTEPAQAIDPAACDAVASPKVRRVRQLVGRLRPDQTACFRAGTYRLLRRLKMKTPGVTLTSYPGERAKLVGRIWVVKRAAGVEVANLDLNGRNRANLPSPTITANDTVWRGNDVTNGHTPAICFHLGSGTYGNADRTLIEGNRIHNCGRLPAANHHHGIYVLHADDSVIRDNWIYDNADRGINLYPDADGVEIVANVIDGNGEGVMFAGSRHATSSGDVATRNIISNSQVRWNVESFWPGQVGTGNVAEANCLSTSNPRSAQYNVNGGVAKQIGFTASDNHVVTDPGYIDRDAKDFRMGPLSSCRGSGPGTGG